ncbi:DUF1800 domain-containing protein [Costertonia aggregata]|uniref:DUF1800 domain-containing protein n=1 Tax=Costertonia aggregata TaxID=343403 RepID=A0A7H9ANA6_9FLAO|nr:DUF1800 domain-containing protein [Costertonia aggregata]QLG44884.1 DUF1800 domain-containing protein [Costertonia aggregata]
MEYFVNCNLGTLAPYTTPLDRAKAKHLYRRLGFSASVATIDAAVGQSATAIADALVDQALALPPLPEPVWANWNNSNYPEDEDARRQLRRQQVSEWRIAYTTGLLENTLRDRMSFFWSNHFVTELDIYDCNAFLHEYTNCLQRNSLGNFKTFVSEIGLTSAMLRYLDGAFNRRNRPNENYARELYELFTLGEGNGYTEDDIVDTSKALTGYTNRGEIGCSFITFDPEQFNTDAKTVFGQPVTDYDSIIDNLFDQRPNEIGYFISKKLYRFFVHPDSNAPEAQPILNGMAATFVSSGFEIAPVLRQLFKSEHFFDDTTIGVIIKSPFDIYLNLTKETNFAYNNDILVRAIDSASLIGQTLFDPVDVAGWQRDRKWINTNYMIGRWFSAEMLLEMFWSNNEEQFRTFGIDATNAAGASGSTEGDPAIVARAIIDKLTPKGLLEEVEYNAAITVFRQAYEDNGFYADENGGTSLWNMTLERAPLQVYELMVHITKQPEFQLK